MAAPQMASDDMDRGAVWADATALDKAARFAAFRAAIDREEAAARSYADVLANEMGYAR